MTRFVSTFITLLLVSSSTWAVQGLESISVPEGFTVESAVLPGLTAYPMFITFDDQGNLFIAESTGKDLSGAEMIAMPECQILRLTDEDGDGVYDHRTVFATDLSLPMGILWHGGSIYSAAPPQYYRFQDKDGDGVAETREIILEGWNFANTASLHGPFLGPDRRLYLTHGRHGYSIKTKEGTLLEGKAARIWRCNPDGTQLERYAGGGFDNPVEMVFMPSGEMLGTMTYYTDPHHGQRDALMHWTWGGAYPKPQEVVAELILTGDLMPTMSKFARIAPAGLLRTQSDALGEEYKNNLFSAQFNPHRIMRHRVFRDGATFRTEDIDFLTSSSGDFYPTDVEEDADGSLLFCDTGAWYVDACPVSRIAKPEIKGSIYRIRANNMPTVEDPWGITMGWQDMTWEHVCETLHDPRFRVREKALDLLCANAEQAVEALMATLENAQFEDARIKAVRALAQAKNTAAVDAVQDALEDAAEDVRIAAANALADIGSQSNAPALKKLLRQGTPPERREAARSLGILGGTGVSEALLSACTDEIDRFEEHAIIYALITLADTQPLARGLRAQSPNTRRAALIALDQIASPELKAQDLLPFLEDLDPEVRKTGLWVAAHHAEWSSDLLTYVARSLETLGDDDAQPEGLHELLLALAGEAQAQALIAIQLGTNDASAPLQQFLLNIIAATNINPIPDSWRDAIGVCLSAEVPAIRAQALDLVRARNIEGLSGPVAIIANNTAEDVSIRLTALSVLAEMKAPLADDQIRFVLNNLEPDAETTHRQAAARLLPRMVLSAETQQELARNLVPSADAVILPGILTTFSQTPGEAIGTLLVDSLAANPNAASLLNTDRLDATLADYPDTVRAHAADLRATLAGRDEAKVARFTSLEPHLGTGDVGRGRRIFFSKEATCFTCHAIGDEGGKLGPDLTTIGLVRSGHDLLEAILFPNSTMVPDYTPIAVATFTDLYSGILDRETHEGVTLKTGPEESVFIPRGDIESMEASTLSLMPEGIDAALSDAQVIDLVTFLQSLNNDGWLLPVIPEDKKDH